VLFTLFQLAQGTCQDRADLRLRRLVQRGCIDVLIVGRMLVQPALEFACRLDIISESLPFQLRDDRGMQAGTRTNARRSSPLGIAASSPEFR
jgi:hypothetical protein